VRQKKPSQRVHSKETRQDKKGKARTKSQLNSTQKEKGRHADFCEFKKAEGHFNTYTSSYFLLYIYLSPALVVFYSQHSPSSPPSLILPPSLTPSRSLQQHRCQTCWANPRIRSSTIAAEKIGPRSEEKRYRRPAPISVSVWCVVRMDGGEKWEANLFCSFPFNSFSVSLPLPPSLLTCCGFACSSCVSTTGTPSLPPLPSLPRSACVSGTKARACVGPSSADTGHALLVCIVCMCVSVG